MKNLNACFIIGIGLLNDKLCMFHCFVLLVKGKKAHEKLQISLLPTFCRAFSFFADIFLIFLRELNFADNSFVIFRADDISWKKSESAKSAKYYPRGI